MEVMGESGARTGEERGYLIWGQCPGMDWDLARSMSLSALLRSSYLVGFSLLPLFPCSFSRPSSPDPITAAFLAVIIAFVAASVLVAASVVFLVGVALLFCIWPLLLLW